MSKEEIIRIVLVAGESSGDQHAAQLVEVLKQKNKNFVFHGMGMSAMEAAGVELIENSTDIAITGILKALSSYSIIKRKLDSLKHFLSANPPQLLILVDYPDFNLNLAKAAHHLGIKTLFYISPQVWAWRRKRIKKISRIIDVMAVIFPFEVELYQQEKQAVHYVGHPLIDTAYAQGILPRKISSIPYSNHTSTKKNILLLPGSREVEVKYMLAVLCKAAKMMQNHQSDLCFSLLIAENLDDNRINSYLQNIQLECELLTDKHTAMQQADFAITASGTVTLELAIYAIPMLVIYKLDWLSYCIAKLLVKTPYIALPNILAHKLIVPELIQAQATAESISNKALSIIQDTEHMETIIHELENVTHILDENGSSERLAGLVCEMLNEIQSTSV